jgi:predicted dienelactone hydrolase
MLLAVAVAAMWHPAAGAAEERYAIGRMALSVIDESRPIMASAGFAGAPQRRLDVIVWYPARTAGEKVPVAPGAPRPLVIYSHGTWGQPDNAMYLVGHLVRHGYVVAAPTYPLSSSVAFTRIDRPDIRDVVNQVGDLGFLIDRLLAEPFLKPAIDPAAIGTTGHSLGGVTSYFASFGGRLRDPRIVATAPIGAGDPVQSALTADMGLAGTAHAEAPVPTLFLSAEKDVFARSTGRPHAAYARIAGPKYEVLVKGGTHVWFRDGNERPADGKNPDCLFFETWTPNVIMPGCEARGGLIAPERQKEIARTALLAFFDAYLKGDSAALARLRGLDRELAGIVLLRED